MTFKEKLCDRIQQYRKKAEELYAQRDAIDKQLQTCEVLLNHWEKSLQAEEAIESGVELPVLEETSPPHEEGAQISVPKAVEEIMNKLARPAGVKEITQRVQTRYPDLNVRNLGKLINITLMRPPSGNKYERVERGIYKLRPK